MEEMPISLVSAPQGYVDWLADLKGRIHTAQELQTSLSSIDQIKRELTGHANDDVKERQHNKGMKQ